MKVGSLGAWDQHENKTHLMIHSCWLQAFMSNLIVELIHCSVAVVVWMICYDQPRTTIDTFNVTAALCRYAVEGSICHSAFLWWQKCWSGIIALLILNRSAL